MKVLALFLGSSLALVTGCSSAPTEDTGANGDELRTSYGDLNETLKEADYARWSAVKTSVTAGFDRKCGDTICSGDFSNLTTVRLACSSTRSALKMKDCLWVLAGNIDYVDGTTGAITSEDRIFSCHIPVASNAKTLLSTLEAAGENALDTPLPGTDGSFYDALVTCFAGVVGAAPPPATTPFYVELGDEQWAEGEAQGAAWSATKQKLARAFDDVCGDSFCEGDYSDYSALRFACSVNANTKRVKSCGWSFGAAETSVDSNGKLSARTITKRCDIAIGASATALTAALSGPDPLNAALPNKTTSVYDALVGCL